MAAGLWAATGSQSRRRSAGRTMVVALVGGTFMGAYLMWEFFPNQPFLQVRHLHADAFAALIARQIAAVQMASSFS